MFPVEVMSLTKSESSVARMLSRCPMHAVVPADPDVNLREQVRQILINGWDPADCARQEAAHDVYNGYISPLAELIQSGGDEEAIIDFLKEREAETMCFPALGTRHLRFVAKKLRSLHRAGG
jgi:hypothetical protein